MRAPGCFCREKLKRQDADDLTFSKLIGRQRDRDLRPGQYCPKAGVTATIDGSWASFRIAGARARASHGLKPKPYHCTVDGETGLRRCVALHCGESS